MCVCSLQVQCEYPAPQPGAAGRSAAIMAAPTPLVAMGTIGVQMRIATGTLRPTADASLQSGVVVLLLVLLCLLLLLLLMCGVLSPDSSFSSFLSADQLPTAFPLRSPVHVEVSLRAPAPEPGLSLRVGDCFAYPASRTAAWRLLHHGSDAPPLLTEPFGIQDGKRDGMEDRGMGINRRIEQG